MSEILYSQTKAGIESLGAAQHQASLCSAKINTEAALVQSAQNLSDATLENIAVLLTQRQVVARKMLAPKTGNQELFEIMANTMDYINDELRKLLAL